MTAGEQRTIGMDRPVKLEWLDAVAGRLAAGDSPKAAREYVWNLLEGVVAGATAQTARGKTLTVLARVWLTPPAAALALREAAVKALVQASADERLAIHWAMLSASHPFFVDVAGLVGKSLGLNGEVALSQLTRRLVDTWGDRSTLRRATQRLVRSMVQWGALREGGKVGVYLAPSKRIAVPSTLGGLLVEGLLIAAQCGMPLNQLVSHPAVFPFDVRTDLTALRRSERLQVHRQGDQTDFIERVDRPAPKPRDDAAKLPGDNGAATIRPSTSRTKNAKGIQTKGGRGSGSGKRESKPARTSKQLPLFGKPPGACS
ncbi:MAG: hypothetical protein COW73_04315 [Nitrospirae bacterium CG18_big_fil_WC_8_21_14_2_50_70_55]|nr:MAG: hypothetical protein AUK30_08475 [Nitrospirae bacterium CG2_30_70_394]PIQ05887.1 MAG: hypothetical protein COW73_04315 [Nitrospirae bacterium CG18_big_fil_WC_8_21_14_2_50_70_55]PIW82083.1 MAG: hypothetical protein COZ96_10590 [Nitrospirae bacterium CG_4_8_14_3_um_filter_70_85]PIX83744.1 MAG: hypothetical protein COZ33_03860 [Nitrospirae bacterium CG_4_10_14_3_um_filter_70_108]PJB96815.1 MAG: hypothetical protein CO080_01950 [Nitrospirae bacterium CG_4_9_14_0_8_um_filter_70_14]